MNKLKVGQKVFTINADTNELDEWTYGGDFTAQKDKLLHLVNGKKYCYLPERCVYGTESQAREILKKF